MTSMQSQLQTLANDLWWSWQEDGYVFWSEFGADAWQTSRQNPVLMLRTMSGSDIESGVDRIGVDAIQAFATRHNTYLQGAETWHKTVGKPIDGLIAYFSAEYGIHESMPNYSGGLGVLAGDHVKSASDLGLPFLAVGLLYRNGYVRQQIDGSGQQVAVYEDYDFDTLAVQEALVDGKPVIVEVPILNHTCAVKVWTLQVGRVTIHYLDTDLEENSDELRGITNRLYGGGVDLRIKQELVLGVGGIRALRALDIHPTLFHLNEGHSSFLVLERAREYIIQNGGDLWGAIEALRPSNAFTTHTPVEAGHDRFSPDLAYRHLAWWAHEVGIDGYQLLDLGRWPGNEDPNAAFNMTLLAMKFSEKLNGVAALHGEVSRQMFARYWPNLTPEEVPISHVTNGVHAPSWQSPALHSVLEASLGEGYRDRPSTDKIWSGVEETDSKAIWAAHLEDKAALIEMAVGRENARRNRLGLDSFNHRFDPSALTIGFARRFATYKRGDLIFSDLDRLFGILENAPGAVQFFFSGKAHPADEHGQAVLKRVYEASQHDALHGRILLIEDYDIEVGRRLVQGVDVWLNNPRRPKEASGTSGMKVAMNGGLNLSILDGWWPEGFNGTNGWAIGDEAAYPSPEAQDAADLESLYSRLENDVIPTYYSDMSNGYPSKWMPMMKSAIKSCTPQFHSHRQVIDYVHHIYAAS